MFYFFDGTKEGFLSAFWIAFSDSNAVVTSKTAQLSLTETPVYVPTDHTRAERAKDRLLSFDRYCMDDLDRLLRHGASDNEQTAFRYFRYLAHKKRPVRKQLAEPSVFNAVEYCKQIGLEVHRFHGFLRFMETDSGALYAPFSPDHDICDLLVPHFRNRLPQFPFVIHDVKRNKAAVYDGTHSFIAPLQSADVVVSADENAWQTLWKDYYEAVNIPDRQRLRQMRGYMPVRYWQFLPEKQS